MKPIDQPKYQDVYLLLHQSIGGTFMPYGIGGQLGPTLLGSGFYQSLELAQQHQMLEALKGIRTEIFHLEYPVK
jgi:hypothetical protein